MNFNLNIFGPKLWMLIHIISLNVNTEIKKKKYINFCILLSHLFPCNKCKYNLQKKLKLYSFEKYIHNNASFHWSVVLHNTVNEENNKIIYNNIKKLYDYYLNLSYNINNYIYIFFDVIQTILYFNMQDTSLYELFINTFVYLLPNSKIKNRMVIFLKDKTYNITKFLNNVDLVNKWFDLFKIYSLSLN